MEISPAILVRDLEEFKRELDAYTGLFDQIDIDINIEDDEFAGKVTTDFNQVLELIKDKTNKFGLHLMATKPKELIDTYLNSNIKLNCIFYIHQESNIEELLVDERYTSLDFSITLNAATDLKTIDYYNQFSEVQLMTVESGFQGNDFKNEALEKAVQLREGGYTGKISIDGGVSLETAELIKKFPIDRVSVGSYFAKAHDIKTSKEELEKALQ